MCPPKTPTSVQNTEEKLQEASQNNTNIPRKNRLYTLEQVEAHNTPQDAWLIIDDKIYDATKFVNSEIHPGGEVIFTHAGKDATDVFHAYHQEYVFKKKLPKYLVGRLDKPLEISPMQKEYRAMHEEIKKAGLYETRPFYWAFKCIYPLVLCAAGVYISWYANSSNWMVYALAGFLIGLGQHQTAFIGHDGCHVSITGHWMPDFLLSLFWATGIFGVSGIWWKYTHNQHHVVCNEYDIDPDITHLPFYAVNKYMFLSKKKAKSMTSFELAMARFIVGLQWITFFPIMVFIARISMMFNVVAMLFFMKKVPTMPHQKLHLSSGVVNLERVVQLAHFVLYYYVMFVWPPAEMILPMFLAQHMTVGSLHIQLTLSHWDRPTKHSSEETDNWFVKQVVTGRNIEGDIFTEWYHGGLHFQIEHHLYPRMPRHNLRKARDLFVRPFCEKHNIDYCSTSFTSALYDVWAQLADVSSHAYDPRVE